MLYGSHTLQITVRGRVLGCLSVDVILGLAGLLGEEHGVDSGHQPVVDDGERAQQSTQLLAVARRWLDVPRHDLVLLVVPRRVAGRLQGLNQRERNETVRSRTARNRARGEQSNEERRSRGICTSVAR